MALKADIRHLIETDHGDNNLLYTVGLSIPFGKKASPATATIETIEVIKEPKPIIIMDSDNDGVIDRLDQCPNTAFVILLIILVVL